MSNVIYKSNNIELLNYMRTHLYMDSFFVRRVWVYIHLDLNGNYLEVANDFGGQLTEDIEEKVETRILELVEIFDKTN